MLPALTLARLPPCALIPALPYLPPKPHTVLRVAVAVSLMIFAADIGLCSTFTTPADLILSTPLYTNIALAWPGAGSWTLRLRSPSINLRSATSLEHAR